MSVRLLFYLGYMRASLVLSSYLGLENVNRCFQRQNIPRRHSNGAFSWVVQVRHRLAKKLLFMRTGFVDLYQDIGAFAQRIRELRLVLVCAICIRDPLIRALLLCCADNGSKAIATAPIQHIMWKKLWSCHNGFPFCTVGWLPSGTSHLGVYTNSAPTHIVLAHPSYSLKDVDQRRPTGIMSLAAAQSQRLPISWILNSERTRSAIKCIYLTCVQHFAW